MSDLRMEVRNLQIKIDGQEVMLKKIYSKLCVKKEERYRCEPKAMIFINL
jgi:hypothetical protein